MITEIKYNSKKYTIDLSKPLDISIPLRDGKNNVSAWYLEPPKIFPVVSDDWIGSVKEGADVNFNTIHFNPHAHCTHTETSRPYHKKSTFYSSKFTTIFLFSRGRNYSARKN